MTDPSSPAFIWRQLGGRLVRMPVVRQITGWRPPAKDIHSPLRVPTAEMPRTKKQRANRRGMWVVDTLCFHQTGVEFGTSRRQRKKWGSEELALIARFAGTPYHYVATLGAGIVHANDLRAYTYHGNRANGRSVGIAIEGHFPGHSVKRTAKHTRLSRELVERGISAASLAVKQAGQQGGEITKVTAHRCWSGSRGDDPGEEIWERIVVPVMEKFGLEMDDTVDERNGGRPVPEGWWS